MSPNAAKINAKYFGVCHLQHATAFPFALPDPLPDFFSKKLHARKNGKRLSGGYPVGKQQAGIPLLTCPDPYWALPAFCPSTGVGIPAPVLCNSYSVTTRCYYLMLMLEISEGVQMDWDFQ